MTGAQLLTCTLLIPLIGSIAVLAVGLIWRRAAGAFALLTATAALLADAALIPIVSRHGTVAIALESTAWLKTWGAHFALRADAMSVLVVLTMSIVTVLAIIYSFGYYRERPQSAAFYALITLFLGGMIGTAVSAGIILFYLFWELMLVPSFALVTFWGEGSYAVKSGFKYFVYTHVGAVAILGAFLWIYSRTGVTDIYAIGAALAGFSPATLTALAALLIFGFAVKMAIFPFHSWLPGTYDDAPVPITIIISGAMIGAGIYGMIRFPFTFFPRDILEKFQTVLLILAVITQIYGGLMALTAKRLRRILAYSSISQMGYVLFGIATLSRMGVSGSLFHLFNHGVIKALLFMVIGAVVLRTSRQKTNEVGGLALDMPLTAWSCAIGALAIAGVPPLNGFQSEWLMLAGGFATPHWWLAILSLVAGVLTAGYALMLVKRVFFGPRNTALERVRESPALTLTPMLILTAVIIAVGIVPGPIMTLINQALAALGFGLI